MADITPLPSPLFSGDSPGPWRRMGSRPGSRDMTGVVSTDPIAIVAANGEPLSSAMASQKRRRAYHGLMSGSIEVQSANSPAFQDNGANHASGRRSLSEYVPEAMQVQRPRQVTVSGAAAPPLSSDQLSPPETQMHREEYLATQRGLAVVRPPTPPPSNRSGAESDDSDSPSSNTQKEKQKIQQLRKPIYEYFYAATVKEGKRRRWRAVRQLGQGTFSKVILATSEGIPDENRIDEGEPFSNIDVDEREKDQRKLVAVKVIEHGPAGGADEQRVESSLKRELDILKSIRHPSLVHLRAFSVEHTRALLVLSYCPGGDMFDVASQHQHLLVPSLIRRMFCELVAAVRYLHAQYIVHRDIKLENVLLNLPIIAFPSISNWQSYPYAIITLTDLGLSRRILPPPDSPLLTTRCGSEDYASPELLMGQPYDGRATDAWALGVFLYALMEGRLPFDPLPSQGGGADARRMRSRTAHRVARCEWAWVKYADEEGEWDAQKGQELEGGREAVEGLLKRARSRLSLDTVVKSTWVNEGIQVDGGLRFKEEEDWDM
ncbi:MAG: hypothetical protein M1827_002628 [Pycnora praestabilis]|nr:MAG: hypothetical protein M1827_002628 [Pycnora praestabilis]